MLILEQCSKAFDGYQYVYSHESFLLECQMKFGIYIPSIADDRSVPLLIFLSDMFANEQNFITKSGMQCLASKYGFIVANPDTIPRCKNVDNDDDAGFYIDAIESQYSDNYQMFSYVNDEFYELILQNFNVDIDRIGIFGFGMGGHGALISYFKCPGQYKSISAFAPIDDELSRKAFRKYLGEDENLWKDYDPCELVQHYQGPLPLLSILIDQGSENEYKDKSNRFLEACTNASFPLQYREQIGYKNDEYFLQTFLNDHFKYHKKQFE